MKMLGIGVRQIISLCLTFVFCYLAVMGKVSMNEFLPIFSMTIGYYFGKSTALDSPGGKNNEQ